MCDLHMCELLSNLEQEAIRHEENTTQCMKPLRSWLDLVLKATWLNRYLSSPLTKVQINKCEYVHMGKKIKRIRAF